MPSNAPRCDTSKKREQLQRRRQKLEHAIRCAFSRDQLVRIAEELRSAQLSFLKAKLHWAEDSKVRGHDVHKRVANIQDDMRSWTERAVEEIIHDYVV